MAFRDARPSERRTQPDDQQAVPSGFRDPNRSELIHETDPLGRMHRPIESYVDEAKQARRAKTTGPGPHPYARRDQPNADVWAPTESDILRAHGVSPEGAPSYVRSLASYTRTGSFTPETLSTALEGYFDQPVETRERDGRMEYKSPKTGRWTVYNPPGLDLGDIASFEGELYPTVGSLGGAAGLGMLGGLAGPGAATAGAFTGDYAGTMLGEYQRLRRGRDLGLIGKETSDVDLMADAATTAALQSGIGLGTTALAKLATNVFATTGLKGSTDDLADRIRKRLSEARESGIEPTTAQALEGTPAGEVLLRDQERLLRSPTPYGDEVRGRQFENVQRAAQTFDEALPPATGAQDLPSIERYIRRQSGRRLGVGEDIQEAARANRSITMQPAYDELNQLEQNAIEAAQNIGETTRGTEVGGDVRDALERAVTEFRDTAEAKYGQVRDLMGSAFQVTPDQVLKLARDRKKLIDSDVYKQLSPEDRNLINQTLKLAGKKGQGPREVSYEQADRAVKQLRRLERESRRGIRPAPEMRLVRDLKEQWEGVRSEIASTVPGGVEKLEAADAYYRENISKLYTSIVGNLLDRKPGTFEYALPEEQIFSRIFRARQPDRAREVFAIVDRPEFGRARQKIGEAVKQEWKDRVIRDDGKVNPTAHSRFMRDYGEQVRLFLSRDERMSMNNAAEFKQKLDQQKAAIKRLEDEAKRNLDVKIENLEDPAEVIPATWNRKKPTRAVELKRLLDSDSQGEKLIPAYKSVIKRQLFNDATSQRQGTRQIDAEKLETLVDEMADPLNAWFGAGTAGRLDELAKAVRTLEAQPLQGARPRGLASEGTDITRASVGQFTVLGRMLTAALRAAGRRGDKISSQLLLDPDYLEKMQRRQQRMKMKPTQLGVGMSALTLPALSESESNFNPRNRDTLRAQPPKNPPR